MTPEKARKIRAIAKQLQKLAHRADALELHFHDGAEVGNLIGALANDLNVMLENTLNRE